MNALSRLVHCKSELSKAETPHATEAAGADGRGGCGPGAVAEALRGRGCSWHSYLAVRGPEQHPGLPLRRWRAETMPASGEGDEQRSTASIPKASVRDAGRGAPSQSLIFHCEPWGQASFGDSDTRSDRVSGGRAAAGAGPARGPVRTGDSGARSCVYASATGLTDSRWRSTKRSLTVGGRMPGGRKPPERGNGVRGRSRGRKLYFVSGRNPLSPRVPKP